MDPIKGQEAEALPDFVLQQFAPGNGEYNHQQLYRILQGGIRQSTLPAGHKLPPTRAMAKALGIARNTVVQVYEQLVLEGLAQAGVGRGTYVADAAPGFVGRARTAPPVGGSALSQRGAGLVRGALASPMQWGAFTPGVPEVRMFPAKVWSRLQSQAWRDVEPAHLSYATGAGHPALREAITDYLRGTRGVICDANQVVVTSGTQQALHLVAQLLADNGDRAWLEDPGYWGARAMFRTAGLTLEPVGLDTEGLAPTEQQLRTPPRLMFLSPAHQYPTGVLMSHGRRRQLLDYAARHRVWIVEDDYDSEFRFAARPLPSLQGLDEQGRVLYLGTFSKTLYPSLRLAYLVLPRTLVESFTRALNELYREGQTLQQVVLARFMREGHYARHIRRMRGIYATRRAALIDAVTNRFGDRIPLLGSDAGLHLALGLPPEVDDGAVAEVALAAGVMTRPLSMYSLRRPAPFMGLVLGYGAVSESEIQENFKKLAAVLRRYL